MSKLVKQILLGLLIVLIGIGLIISIKTAITVFSIICLLFIIFGLIVVISILFKGP